VTARSSGFQELDRALPIGGWPVGALTEIMPRTEGIGELRLAMPALAKLTHERRYIAFVDPPHLPYPAALAQHGVHLDRTVFINHTSPATSLWAAEQMLRYTAFGAVLLWCTAIGDKELRRLQLAAEAGKTLAFLYRPSSAALSHSPAALRLCLHIAERSLCIEIKKCRGGYAGGIVRCALEKDPGTDQPADTPSPQVA
jgi:cell division inhibitor SulA/protein ImuA